MKRASDMLLELSILGEVNEAFKLLRRVLSVLAIVVCLAAPYLVQLL